MSPRKPRLKGIADEVQGVVAQAKEWGMHDKDIEECLREILDAETSLRTGSGSSPNKESLTAVGSFSFEKYYKRTISCVVTSLKWFGISLVLFCGFSIMVDGVFTCFPTLGKQIDVKMQQWQYPMLTNLRRYGLDFAQEYGMGNFWNEECLVYNPYHAIGPMETCEACHNGTIEEIPGTPADDALPLLQEWALSSEKIFVIRGYDTVGDDALGLLKEVVDNNADIFSLATNHRFDGFNTPVQSVQKFLAHATQAGFEKEYPDNFRATWSLFSVSAAQTVRQIFSRPSFVPLKSEVALQRTLFFEGPTAKPYPMEGGLFSNNWLIQVIGTRDYHLIPHPDCVKSEECEQMTFTLNPGDIVKYDDFQWELESCPPESVAPTPLSVSYKCSFG